MTSKSESELSDLSCVDYTKDDAYWLRTYLSIYDAGLFNGMIRSTNTSRDHKMIQKFLKKIKGL